MMSIQPLVDFLWGRKKKIIPPSHQKHFWRKKGKIKWLHNYVQTFITVFKLIQSHSLSCIKVIIKQLSSIKLLWITPNKDQKIFYFTRLLNLWLRQSIYKERIISHFLKGNNPEVTKGKQKRDNIPLIKLFPEHYMYHGTLWRPSSTSKANGAQQSLHQEQDVPSKFTSN